MHYSYMYMGENILLCNLKLLILQLTLSPKILFGAALLKVIINFSDPLDVAIIHNLHITWN